MTDKLLKANSGNLQLGDVVTVDQTNSRLGIGTASPACKLDIKTTNTSEECFRHTADYGTTTGRYYSLTAPSVDSIQEPFVWATGNSHAWYVDDQERMRIDFTGRLLVGKTTHAIATPGWIISGAGQSYYTINSSISGYGTLHIYNVNTNLSGYRFYVMANGGIANFSANNVNLSDERVKTDISLASSYLDKICAIPVKTFRYKDQGEDIDLTLGVIAQDVEAVAPELVNTTDGFGDLPEDGVPLKTVYQTDLQYALMKCIQELKAELDEAKARIQTLEGGA